MLAFVCDTIPSMQWHLTNEQLNRLGVKAEDLRTLGLTEKDNGPLSLAAAVHDKDPLFINIRQGLNACVGVGRVLYGLYVAGN